MTKYSLRARMMILILAPTLLIGLLLTTFFVVHRYNQLQEQLLDSGSSIIEPLAIACEYGMTFHNRKTVQQLVELIHRRHTSIIRSITIFDPQNNLFATSHYQDNSTQLPLPKGVPIPSELMLTRHGNSLILRTPITARNRITHSDVSTALQPLKLGYVAIELDLRTIQLQQYKEVFVAILLLIICLCIAMLFAYRLMRDVTGPIRNMVNTVDRIRQGQLDSRVEGYMLGELNTLKNGINSMAISLADYHEEMQQNIAQATSDLRETLEQMEIQNIELDLAKKRAQEASRIKSEFLANMSHELRTPLNGVIGFTRQMLKTSLTPTQIDYLQTIERSGNNLLSIINDVLDFSKLEAGKLLLESIPFSLRETLDEVLILLVHSAHEKGIELTQDIHQDVPDLLVGDPLRLQQILTNLLGNAIKFTEQGNIDIRVEVRSRYDTEVDLEVQVHDTGIGISEQQQSKLFQAFRQADASVSRSHGGTGLGLVISQKLVREMGGDINFHSQPNKGSTFWFYIRVGLNIELPAQTMIGNPLNDLQGKSLLYVEANPNAAHATLSMLSHTVLDVTHCLNVAQAPQRHFDILLASIPISVQRDLNNYRERFTRVKNLASRIILALPTQTLLDAEFLKQLGVESCLVKPLSQPRLFQALLASQQHFSSHTDPQPTLRLRLPIQVMAVDDNPANLKLIGALLEELVENPILCHSAEAAINIASKQKLDVILMDIQMPKIDGIKAAELIHKLPLHTNTPIIAVTAHAGSDEQENLIKVGMDGYLTKPIDEKILAQVLSSYITKPHLVMEQYSEPTTITAKTKNEPSLNWELALQQAAHKEGLAQELLSMLLAFLPEVHQRINHILAGKIDDSIADLLHKLHGSCSYSGVPRLKQACQYIEQQLKQEGIKQADLEPEWMELLDEIESVQREGQERVNNTQ